MVMVSVNEVFVCLYCLSLYFWLALLNGKEPQVWEVVELIFLTSLVNKLKLLANAPACYLHFSSWPCCHKGSSKPPRGIWRSSQGHRELMSDIMEILSVIFGKSWQIREALGGCSLANFSTILQTGEKKVDFTNLRPHQWQLFKV